MSQYVTKIRTDQGDKQIDYNALANLPTISNPNLLINGDFKINQRGSSIYGQVNEWTYSVDRWRYIGLMSVTVNSSGTVTISKSGNSNETFFAQRLEASYPIGDYTFSFKVKSITGTMSVYIEGGSDPMLAVTQAGTYEVHSSNTANGVVFRLDGTDANVELEWAKLECGKSATLFSPRLAQEELDLCRRFFCIMGGVRISGVEQDYTANTFTYAIPRNCIMARTPDISIRGTTTTNSTDGICVRTIGCAIIPNFTFTYSLRSWEVLIIAKSSSALTENCYETQLYINDAFKLCLDAEIY